MIGKATKIGLIALMLMTLAGVVYFGGVAYKSIVPQAWASWSQNVDRIRAEEAREARIEKAAKDDTYSVVCGDYFNASFFEKMWTLRQLKWCEDYKDRMPS